MFSGSRTRRRVRGRSAAGAVGYLAAVLLASATAGCLEDGRMVVDLRTDLVHGQEFDLVRIELHAVDGGPAAAVESQQTGDYLRGVRVAEFSDVANGGYRVEVVAVRAGYEVQRQRASLVFHGSAAVTVVLTRDCRGVVCPGASGAESACLRGRCAEARCAIADERCEIECEQSSDCPGSDDPCARSACVEGRCFAQWACVGAPAVCGDGIVELDEQCEPGGAEPCDPDCMRPSCRPGCTCETGSNGVRTMFCADELTWAEARAACASVGMALISVDDADENAMLAARGVPLWIGGSDRLNEGVWRWEADGRQFWSGAAQGRAIDDAFAVWSTSEPNHYRDFQDCARMMPTGAWDDLECHVRMAFACEAPGTPDAPTVRAETGVGGVWVSWMPSAPRANAIGSEFCVVGPVSSCETLPSGVFSRWVPAERGSYTFVVRTISAAGAGAAAARTVPLEGIWAEHVVGPDGGSGYGLSLASVMPLVEYEGVYAATQDVNAGSDGEKHYVFVLLRSFLAEQMMERIAAGAPLLARMQFVDNGTAPIGIQWIGGTLEARRTDTLALRTVEFPINGAPLLDYANGGNLRITGFTWGGGDKPYVHSFAIVEPPVASP